MHEISDPSEPLPTLTLAARPKARTVARRWAVQPPKFSSLTVTTRRLRVIRTTDCASAKRISTDPLRRSSRATPCRRYPGIHRNRNHVISPCSGYGFHLRNPQARQLLNLYGTGASPPTRTSTCCRGCGQADRPGKLLVGSVRMPSIVWHDWVWLCGLLAP